MAQRAADPPWPWLITMSSSCYEYGSSLRFSFSETLPCRIIAWRAFSLSLSFPPPLSPFTYFYFSPSLCLSILSSPERPSVRCHVAYITNSKDQHRETCCSVYSTACCAAVRADRDRRGGARSCVSPSLPDRHHFF